MCKCSECKHFTFNIDFLIPKVMAICIKNNKVSNEEIKCKEFEREG